mmetsp:Transcript_12750/g.35856  ORF Transcript_12750/g.35856 Transcript_12750/m.35856 type:complete len:470 (-) Transcript_12750:88-1497(-)
MSMVRCHREGRIARRGLRRQQGGCKWKPMARSVASGILWAPTAVPVLLLVALLLPCVHSFGLEPMTDLGLPGALATAERFPYLASLVIPETGEHFCMGALINERLVLTATACLDTSSTPLVQLGLDCTNCSTSEGVQSYTVASGDPIPEVSASSPGSGIALLTLAKPAPGPYLYIKPQEDPATWAEWTSLVFSGYALGGDVDSEHKLREGRLLYRTNHDRCAFEAKLDRIPDDAVCALGVGLKLCSTDIGGPLLKLGDSPEEDIGVGLLASSTGCSNDAQSPLMFTALNLYMNILGPVAAERPPPPPPGLVVFRERIGSPSNSGPGPQAAAYFRDLSVCEKVFATVNVEHIDLSRGDQKENVRVRVSSGDTMRLGPCFYNSMVNETIWTHSSCGSFINVMCQEDVTEIAHAEGNLYVAVMASPNVGWDACENLFLHAEVTVECAPARQQAKCPNRDAAAKAPEAFCGYY